MGQSPPVTLDTYISGNAAKRGLFGFNPHMWTCSLSCWWVITGALPAQPVAMGKPPSYLRPPCAPTSQPWLDMTNTGMHEWGWQSDLDLAQADLTPLWHLQNLSSKAEVMEETQSTAGYFWSRAACRFSGRKSKTVWHTSWLGFYALPVVTSLTRHGRYFLRRV